MQIQSFVTVTCDLLRIAHILAECFDLTFLIGRKSRMTDFNRSHQRLAVTGSQRRHYDSHGTYQKNIWTDIATMWCDVDSAGTAGSDQSRRDLFSGQ